MTADLFAPHFQGADKAREYLEALRWPDCPVCPHCGCIGAHYALKGKAHRPGLWKCKDCRKQFSVTVGTVFERSKIPLNKWLMAVHLMCASKKAISSHQIHRMLGVTYKSAWFMTHRIREAMVQNADHLPTFAKPTDRWRQRNRPQPAAALSSVASSLPISGIAPEPPSPTGLARLDRCAEQRSRRAATAQAV